MLSTLHWHPRHPNTYPKPRYMQYFVCEPLHCPCESFLVQSTVRHSLVHFTTEVKYFPPLRLALVEWKPVCKVCLTCQPPSIGTQGTPIYATTPGLWKNLSVGPHVATILHFLLSSMRKISKFQLYSMTQNQSVWSVWHVSYPALAPKGPLYRPQPQVYEIICLWALKQPS